MSGRVDDSAFLHSPRLTHKENCLMFGANIGRINFPFQLANKTAALHLWEEPESNSNKLELTILINPSKHCLDDVFLPRVSDSPCTDWQLQVVEVWIAPDLSVSQRQTRAEAFLLRFQLR